MGGEAYNVAGSQTGGYTASSARAAAAVVVRRSGSSSGSETVDEEYGYVWAEEPVSFILGGTQIDFPAKNSLQMMAMQQYEGKEYNGTINIDYYYVTDNGEVSSTTKNKTWREVDISDIANEYSTATVFLGITETVLHDGDTTSIIFINNDPVEVQAGNSVVYNAKEYVFDGTEWHEDELSIKQLYIDMPALGGGSSGYGSKVCPNLITSDAYNNSKKRTYGALFLPTDTVFRSVDSFVLCDYLCDNVDYILKGSLSLAARRPYQIAKKNGAKTIYPYKVTKNKDGTYNTIDVSPFAVLCMRDENAACETEPSTYDKNLINAAWLPGRYQDHDGTYKKDATRICTNKFFRADITGDGTVFTHAYFIQTIFDYKFCVFAYDSSGGYLGCLSENGTYLKAANAKTSISNVQWLSYFDLRNPSGVDGNGNTLNIYYYKFVLRKETDPKAKLTTTTHYMNCLFEKGSSDVFYPIYSGYVDAKDTTADAFSFSKNITSPNSDSEDYEFVKQTGSSNKLIMQMDLYTPNPSKWVDSNNTYDTYLDYTWGIRSFVLRPKNSFDNNDNNVSTYARDIEVPKQVELSVYAADSQRFLRNVRLSKVEKGEINKFGSLEVKVEFECLSPWKEPFSGYVFHGSASDISSSAWNSNMIVIESDSSSLCPCELGISPHAGTSFVNPEWTQWVTYKNVTESVASGKFNGTLSGSITKTIGEEENVPCIEALFINSDTAKHGVSVKTVRASSNIEDGTYDVVSEENRYSSLDFSKSNFIYIRPGVNVIQIKDDNNSTTVDIRLRGNILYESV